MGVRLLKKYLSGLRISGIKKCGINALAGKKIVIDITIYIYKFKINGNLKYNLSRMCSILKYNNISSLFVFDGDYKNPIKNETIKDRSLMKKKAFEEYNNISDKINLETNTECKNTMLDRMNKLKGLVVRINRDDIDTTKKMLKAYGFKYITANGEADELCAELVLRKKAWGCLTEDTDLFIYNCTNVIGYLDLNNGTVVCHNMYNILKNLHMSFEDFTYTCILSGTDYNKLITGNLFENMCNYKLYTRFVNNHPNISYIEWLVKEKIINDENLNYILKIRDIYCDNMRQVMDNIPYILIKNGNTNQYLLKKILN
jgi:hypothetical protein